MTGAGARILVVEDSATQAAALALLLESAGYDARVVRRAELALEALRKERVSLVLSDVVMPGMDGYELCRRIRDVPEWSDIPVVLLTSLTDPLAIVRGLASGAEHYVTKPYEPEALLARVRAVLEREHRAPGFRPNPFTVELLGTPFTIEATKEHILELLVSSYSDLVHTSEAVREAERRARFLADVTALLGATLDVDQVLKDLANLVTPRIADLCVVDRLRADDPRPTIDAAARAVESHGIQVLPAVGFPQLEELVGRDAIPEALEGQPEVALVIVPIVGRERVLALLYCASRASTALTAPETLRLLEDVARRAALAVENGLLYAEAQRATRARDDVLAVVSHDLRNPINTIQMSSSFLLDVMSERMSSATLASQLQVIGRATRRANALIQDLLDVSRIDAGSLAVDAQPASAASLIADAALELGPLVTGNGLNFEHRWDGADVDVAADKGRIIQVFSNLVGNAVKFTQPGGVIRITGSRAQAGARFEVADTGAGIPADHLPHLFDRFWKASQTSRSGAGLGLSIARGIVDSHRGVLDVESTPGKGTTFTFTLPETASPARNS